MRSTFILLLLAVAASSILVWPQLGVLAWTWVSYMNPHRLTFGAAQDFPVGMVIAIVTLVSWAISKEPKEFPYNGLIVLLIVYWCWTTLTTTVSLNPDWAWPKWTKFSKILLFTLITYSLMRSYVRLNALIWVIVLSVSFYCVKGGLFTIATAGSALVWGPPGSFFGDNNAVALALIMVLPFIRYLQQQIQNRLFNIAFMGWLMITFAAVLGTSSRGALVGIVACFAYITITSRRIMILVVVSGLAVSGMFLMPESWSDRMLTTLEYEEDSSAQGRLHMWQYAINVAAEKPITGGGFDIFYHQPSIAKYAPKREDGHSVRGRAAHSIYFEVLAEHGYIGLVLFLLLGAKSILTARRIHQQCRLRPDLKWAKNLSYAIQVSLVAYAVSGAFLSLANFDLYYHVVAMTAITQLLVARQLKNPPSDTPLLDPFVSEHLKPKARKFNPYSRGGD
jgi:probable O-glycosylation ligase (exosortase A-associated)